MKRNIIAIILLYFGFNALAVTPIITILPDTAYIGQEMEIKIKASKRTEIAIECGK